MVRRFPHTMTITTAGEATLDSKGNWTGGAAATTEHACRFETNTDGTVISGENGMQVVYEGIVYTKAAGPFTLGSAIEVQNEAGEVIAKGSVKQVVKCSFHTKLWL